MCGILYGLMGIINIFLGFLTAEPRSYPSRSRNTNPYRKPWHTRWGQAIAGFFSMLLSPILWIFDHPLAACRFGFRYVCKALLRVKGTKKHSKEPKDKKKPSGEKELSEKELSLDDGSVEIPYEHLFYSSTNIHFADLVTASDVSKEWQGNPLGRKPPIAAELRSLADTACQGPGRKDCDLCGIPTCEVCPNFHITCSTPSH